MDVGVSESEALNADWASSDSDFAAYLILTLMPMKTKISFVTLLCLVIPMGFFYPWIEENFTNGSNFPSILPYISSLSFTPHGAYHPWTAMPSQMPESTNGMQHSQRLRTRRSVLGCGKWRFLVEGCLRLLQGHLLIPIAAFGGNVNSVAICDRQPIYDRILHNVG